MPKTGYLKHQQPQQPQILDSFKEHFPHRRMRPNQRTALEILSQTQEDSILMELPTGSGKTALGYTFLSAHKTEEPTYYVTPNKALVNQVKTQHPNVTTIYGRSEYPCLYYQEEEKDLSADQAPCSMIDCPYRVDQETGQTQEKDVEPCPYLLNKYQARKSKIIVCTTAFFLLTQLMSQDWPQTHHVVIDEVHQLASTARNIFHYQISDQYLRRAIEILNKVNLVQAQNLQDFLNAMIHIGKLKPAIHPVILESHEIGLLIRTLNIIDAKSIEKSVRSAIKDGAINPVDDEKTLKAIETVIYNVKRYLHSFQYSLDTGIQHPLNYVYAFYQKDTQEKTHYYLTIAAYYVKPMLKHLLSRMNVLAYSATIGPNAEVLGFETGIDYPYYTFLSDFPPENTRIYLPTDTANLAMNAQKHGDVGRTLRQIAEACQKLARKGLRSLIVVISNKEREKFVEICRDYNLEVITYGNGVSAKEAVRIFRDDKQGDVLVGTSAQFSQGLDLPKQSAPVIFFLRPGYPHPDDPATQFEAKRFPLEKWKIWNWRVTMEALEVRGRNIRSAEDMGVCIFISQQFRRFLPATLPEWLQASLVQNQTFDQAVSTTIKFLQ